MFCPNCGTKCEDGARFCGNCGTQLPAMQQPAEVRLTSVSGSDVKNEPAAEGVIFTNIRMLAAKFDAGRGQFDRWHEAVKGLLLEYAEKSRKRGIVYHLIDAGNYRFLNPKAGGNHVVSLGTSDPWTSYAAILADYYRFGRGKSEDETNYLFIVGGHDTIPMPVVPQYIPARDENDEKDIDTDIPYAYLLGERTYPMFESGKLFNYEQYFHVGRLPLPAVASWEEFQNYFSRSLIAMDGIYVKDFFGVANMLWGEDSVRVCEPLRRCGLLSVAERYHNSQIEGYTVANGGVFYSQPVTAGNIESVFDRSTGFYYFNLHGSPVPTQALFMGEDVVNGRKQGVATLYPAHMAKAKEPNCLVTEACYGARFKGRSMEQSMLLTSIFNQTLIYLGASRAAWCNNRYVIDNSDRLTMVYIDALLAGHTAGEALFLGRQSFFAKGNRLYDQQMVTIVEFNLFGDPFLRLDVAGYKPAAKRAEKLCVLTKSAVHTIAERKCLFDNARSGKQQSLLGLVRSMVDSGIMKIREKIDREVYERLGVEPRKLSFIHKNSFDDGQEFYTFTYDGGNTDFEDIHIVMTDRDGNITTIISSK